MIEEDSHPLARHLVPPAHVIGFGEPFEIGIYHRCYIYDIRPDTQLLDHQLGMLSTFRTAGFVRHQEGPDVVCAEGLSAEICGQRRIQPARQSDDNPAEPGFSNFVDNEPAQDPLDQSAV